jgi:hypothetical protein
MAIDAHAGQSADAIARSATIARNTVADEGAGVLGLLVNQVWRLCMSAARMQCCLASEPESHALLAAMVCAAMGKAANSCHRAV